MLLGVDPSHRGAMVRSLSAWTFLVLCRLRGAWYNVPGTRERHHVIALRTYGEDQLPCNVSAGDGFLHEQSMHSATQRLRSLKLESLHCKRTLSQLFRAVCVWLAGQMEARAGISTKRTLSRCKSSWE